jgi:4-hydroxy-3-polyprenylbenzoate decarboxylase
MKLVVGVTGASGVQVAIRLLEVLKESDHETHLVVSEGARRVMEHEMGAVPDLGKAADSVHEPDDLAAPISSGSFPFDAMVVVPCSMKSLSAIANGYADSLLHRSADVALKQRRTLVLVPRETPLALTHIENMRRAALAGAVILPMNVAYYPGPKTMDDVTDFFVGKILDSLDIGHDLYRRWGEGR